MKSHRIAWMLIAVFALSLGSVLPVAAAQPNATLYEVTESMSVKGGRIARRLAVSALLGTVDAGTSVCPAAIATNGKCSLTALAFDNVDLSTGRGPVSGTFAVVVQDVNTVDGPEVVVLRGTLSGQVNLSQAFQGVPLGSITGSWSASGVSGGPLAGVSLHGTLNGTFRLPFALDGGPALYLTDSGPVPVGDNERSLGTPTVRLDLNFATSGR